MRIIQVLVLITLIIVGIHAYLGIIYFFAIFIGGTLFSYQLYLIKNREQKSCMRAFKNNSWFGLIIFMGLAFVEIWDLFNVFGMF